MFNPTKNTIRTQKNSDIYVVVTQRKRYLHSDSIPLFLMLATLVLLLTLADLVSKLGFFFWAP